MSTLEKKIYAEITVPGNKKIEAVSSKTTYRGLSTVNPDNSSYKLFDIALIKPVSYTYIRAHATVLDIERSFLL